MYGFYGFPPFAATAGAPWADLAATRLAAVPWLVLFTSSDLQAAGLELWNAGMAPALRRGAPELGELVTRMLGTEHRVVLDPDLRSRRRRE